jgi:hypothetical protein
MFRLLVLVCILGVLQSCSPKTQSKIQQPIEESTEEYVEIISTEEIERPVEEYTYIEEKPVPSIVNIPFSLKITELENMINYEFDKALEANNKFEQDGLSVKATKLTALKVSAEGQRIKYLVPIKLYVQKDVGIGTIRADGAIALQFYTDFDILPDWTLITKSQIESYSWVETPKLRLGVVNIPAAFVGDIVMKQSKEVITKSIDQQLKENVDLKAAMQYAWKQLYAPIEISKEYNSWILINPLRLGATPLRNDGQRISFNLFAESFPVVYLGNKPVQKLSLPLPPFKFESNYNQGFQISLITDVPYEHAEALAIQNVKGQEYRYEKYKVKIEDIELYGQGEKLVVDTKLSGSYNGSIYLSGEPFYDNLTNKVDIKNLDYTLGTKNFLLKTAAWLLKSNMRNQMLENVNFLIEYNLETIRKQAQAQLTNYQIASGIFVKGNLDNLGISDVYLTPRGIRVKLDIKGKIDVSMEEGQIIQHTGQ